MDFEKFRIEDGHLVIHQDHLEEGVKEFESEARDCLLDALWMGCDVKLSREGTTISITISVYSLPETEEECFDDSSSTKMLIYTADIFKDMDVVGCLKFRPHLLQSVPVEGGNTVEDAYRRLLQHPF